MARKILLGGELMFPSEYLSAVEFKGKEVTLTISEVKREELKMRGGKAETKPVLSFRETKKRLVCNKTNGDSIGEMYGNNADLWVGKRVTFYPTKTQCGRDTVDCVRVREKKPEAAKAGAPSDDPLDGASPNDGPDEFPG